MLRSRMVMTLFLLVSFAIPFTSPITLYAEDSTVTEVIPGGQSVGVQLHTSGVVVSGFSPLATDRGEISPAKEAGIEVGDIIIRLNNIKVDNMREFASILERLDKEDTSVELMVKRQQNIFPVHLSPIKKGEEIQLGMMIKDATAGIGTMTFYDPNSHKYGALGHMISDQQSNKPMDIFNGKIVPSDVTSINRGNQGIPGEKKARFSMNDPSLGTIQKNSQYGIFGKLEDESFFEDGEPIPVAPSNEVKKGKAQIYTVINEKKVEAFDIEIVSTQPSNQPEMKGMIIRITDERLLEKTGGIVQGMSGSPIIQDGKLVGAVTHVFLNDPTSGYGVHIEWMLNEAGLNIKETSAQAEQKIAA